MKIHLGKTATSRIRKKKVIEEISNQPILQQTDSFTDYLLRKGYSNTTVASFYGDVKKFKAWLTKEDIEPENVQYNDITAYLQSLSNIAQHTKGCYLRSIKQYFNFLIQDEKCIDNPVAFIQLRGIKRKTLYDILNRQELDNLYHHYTLPDEANDSDKNQNWFKAKLLAQKRNKAVLGLILFQGLGTMDLKLLTVSDIRLGEGKIFIYGTRRSNERELTLEAMQIIDLMEYLLKTRNELLQLTGKITDKLFVSIGTSGTIQNIMPYLMERLQPTNRKVTSIKQLRASVIVHWLKLYNLRQVQYMAGHRFVSSTEAFLINEMDGMIEDIDRYHPIV